MSEEKQTGPTWKNRRRVIIISLSLCAFCIIYIMIFGSDTRVNESIVLGSFSLAATVVASYVFGSVWEDNSFKPGSGKHTGETNNHNNHHGGHS